MKYERCLKMIISQYTNNPTIAPNPMMPNGPIFLKYKAMNATMHITKLFQSMKFSGVASVTAAVPMSPMTAGLKPDITPLNIGWFFHVS